MPPRPFPYQLGIGTDIVHIPRIAKLIRPPGAGPEALQTKPSRLQPFLRRILTPREQEDFRHRFSGSEHDAARQSNAIAQYLAGRWAAKEAAIKAHRHRRLTFLDVEILRYSTGRDHGAIFALIHNSPADPVRTSTPRCARLATGGSLPHDASGSPDHTVASGSPDQTDAGCYEAANGTGSSDDCEEGAAQLAQISISHDGEYATAVCLAAEQSVPGDVGGEATARML